MSIIIINNNKWIFLLKNIVFVIFPAHEMIQNQSHAVQDLGQTRVHVHALRKENHHVPTQKIVIDQEVAPQKTTEPPDHQIVMKAWTIKH